MRDAPSPSVLHAVWVTNTCDDLLPAVLLQLSLVCVVIV